MTEWLVNLTAKLQFTLSNQKAALHDFLLRKMAAQLGDHRHQLPHSLLQRRLQAVAHIVDARALPLGLGAVVRDIALVRVGGVHADEPVASLSTSNSDL